MLVRHGTNLIVRTLWHESIVAGGRAAGGGRSVGRNKPPVLDGVQKTCCHRCGDLADINSYFLILEALVICMTCGSLRTGLTL